MVDASRGPEACAARAALALALALALPAPACTPPQTQATLQVAPEVIASIERYRKRYVIARDDLLYVSIRQNAELSRECLVRPDGFITLPLLDDVEAAGRTHAELDEEITRRLAAKLVAPDVSVIALKTRPAQAYVLGEVTGPRAVDLAGAPTVAAAVAVAGGFTDRARKDKVSIVRLVGDHLVAITVPSTIEEQPGVYMALGAHVLQAGDLVVVPETGGAEFDRWIRTFINQPLSGLNTLLSTWANYELIVYLDDDDNN